MISVDRGKLVHNPNEAFRLKTKKTTTFNYSVVASQFIAMLVKYARLPLCLFSVLSQ